MLKRIPLIQAMTRPATVFGLTYNYFALMIVVCLTFTFLTKWYMCAFTLTVSLYITGRWLAAHDSQWLDGFLISCQRIRYQRNQSIRGCRSYAPW
jgi:type IV secretory pathway VirB3-like protein